MQRDFFVGADVSKNKLDICFLTSKDNKKPDFISLPNNYEVIKSYFSSFTKDSITLVFEYTNNYHIALQSALSDLKIKYSALNPEKNKLFFEALITSKKRI